MSNRRRRSQQNNTSNLDETNTEYLLLHEYIGLMSEILTQTNRVSQSYNNNISSILTNVNHLFDNYYRWGRESRESQNSNANRNLSTTNSTNGC